MLDGVDLLLRRLFLDEVALLGSPGVPPSDDQVGFQAPDKDWRTQVTAAGARPSINVYLADLREHPEYRSTEPVRDAHGLPTGQRPPSWVDAHYLVTAWSPAASAAGGRLTEHALLYQVVQCLLARELLAATAVFRTAAFPAGYPAALRDAELPVRVLPGEGFPKLAEFWGAMGADQVWRPTVYLVVTVPVSFPPPPPAPLVSTRVLRLTGDVVQIAGRVLAPAPGGGAPLAVPGAWVRLESAAGSPLHTTRSDLDGRYRFDGLEPASYRLRWRALDRPDPAPKDVDVPGPGSAYDLSFP